MAEDRPWLFDEIPSLHAETQLYTSRRSNSSNPKEYKFTIDDLANFIVNNYDIGSIFAPPEFLFNQTETTNVPAGALLEKIVFVSASDQTVTIETANGAADILENESVTAGQVLVIAIDLYDHLNPINLSIICSVVSTVDNILKIYTR